MKRLAGFTIPVIAFLIGLSCSIRENGKKSDRRNQKNSLSETNQSKMKRQLNNEINPWQEQTFVISHTFEADPRTVFDMWVNPEHFSSWLGPDGARMTFLSTEVREGGTSQWSMTTTDGQTKYGRINFKTITPNHLLVYLQNFCDKEGNFIKAPFSNTYPDYLLTTVSFANENDNQTVVTVKWEIYGHATDTERETFDEMKPIMRAGWTDSFNKLQSKLAH